MIRRRARFVPHSIDANLDWLRRAHHGYDVERDLDLAGTGAAGYVVATDPLITGTWFPILSVKADIFLRRSPC